jgi:hypothetical protein
LRQKQRDERPISDGLHIENPDQDDLSEQHRHVLAGRAKHRVTHAECPATSFFFRHSRHGQAWKEDGMVLKTQRSQNEPDALPGRRDINGTSG